MAKPTGLTVPKLDASKVRTEEAIRADLRQQLEDIHEQYLARWVWPCLPL